MNKENLKKSAIYEFISKETWLTHNSVKIAFWTQKLDILNNNDVQYYISLKKITNQFEWGGIYAIVNKVNNKYYIWQSKDIKKRMWTHFAELYRNKHCNIELQNDYNTLWKHQFEFIVLRKIWFYNKQYYLEQEKKEILSRDNTYNIKWTDNIFKDVSFYRYLCERHKELIFETFQKNNILNDKWIFINKL